MASILADQRGRPWRLHTEHIKVPQRASAQIRLFGALAPLVLAVPVATCAGEPSATTQDKYALPPPVVEASALLDRGRVNEATALLALVGNDTLAKDAEKFGLIDKIRRAEIAKCQYFLGTYAECLDNAGDVLFGAPVHSPPGVHLYGAMAARQAQLWPLVVMFTRGDPEGLAKRLVSLGDNVDERWVREVSLCLCVALARMDRFDEARQRLERLSASAKDPHEAAALRACLAQLDERQRAVRAGEVKPYSATALWLEALDNPSWWVQTEAMREVAKLPDPAVFEKLAARTKHQRAEVRARAAAALGWRGDRRAVDILRPLLKDPNANVRDSARLALERLGEKVE